MEKNLTRSLLVSSNKLDGPRRVTTTTRPMRVALLVDPADPMSALAAIESACVTWGGQHHFLIPCPPSGSPSPIWLRILEKLDPDAILDLVGAEETFGTSQWEIHDRVVHRWEQPSETMQFIGAAVYGPLRRWRRYRTDGEHHLVLNLDRIRDCEFALPLAFRFGHLDERPLGSKVGACPGYGSARLAEFVNLVNVDAATLAKDRLLRLCTEVPLPHPGTFSKIGKAGPIRTLPNLTTTSVVSREPSYGSGGVPEPEYEQWDEAYYRRILVVGAPNSVVDLCIAWNLRAQRHMNWWFPLWVAPEWLQDPAVVANIQRAWNLSYPGLSESGHNELTLHLVSGSLSPSDLAGAGTGLPLPIMAHDDAVLDRFFTERFRTGSSQSSVVTFLSGQADVILPDYQELGEFAPFEWIGWSAAIDRYSPPRGSWRYFFRFGVHSRLAADGIAGWVTLHDPPGTLMTLGTNDALEILNGIAERSGYKAEISDKGRLGIALLGLLQDPLGLAVLSSSKVYDLFQEMAVIEVRQAVQSALRRAFGRDPAPSEVQAIVAALQQDSIGGGQFDRQHKDWGQLRNALGISDRAARIIVNWLVARGILLRGYDVTCPNCGLKRWHPVDRLSTTHRCDGCQVTSPLPVDVDQLKWRYRLNELMARGVDQGVLPHLLVARRITAWDDLLGYLPGVLFRPVSEGDVKPIEVDVFGVKAGWPIIGECKKTGSELSPDEVNRYAALRASLGCSRIIYATTTNFSGIPAVLEQARAATPPPSLDVLDREDLLDHDEWGFARGAPSVSDPAQAYLESLAQSVDRRAANE